MAGSKLRPNPPHPMKTNSSRHSRLRREAWLALLAGCLAACLTAAHAAPPSLQPLPQGKWPALPRGGYAYDVKVVGNNAYVAVGAGGLAVFDVSNATNSVHLGGCNTGRDATAVEVLGWGLAGD